MRAKQPDQTGYVVRDGVRLYYEVYGSGPQTMLFVPPWSIVHSRVYKAQLPYFSERFRCITFDNRGNGKSDRPDSAQAYSLENSVGDALAVMDKTAAGQAVVVGLSFGGFVACVLAAHHPERVKAAILAGTAAVIGPTRPHMSHGNFLKERDRYEGWDKYNRAYWLKDYPAFAEHFVRNIHTEPHSTRQIEDGIAWAGETDGPTLIKTVEARTVIPSFDVSEAMYRKIRCPVLAIHGTNDQIQSYERGKLVAELSGGELVTIEGGGHNVLGRYPAKCNALINDFLDRRLDIPAPKPPAESKPRAKRRKDSKRVLYLSSPIGLGHGRRDIAVARELRKLRPGLQVDWLAQDPVVLIANFMTFQDAVDECRYDLVIADEAWDVDHFWHEHPELKKSGLAWFTDFVGFVPMPGNGAAEEFLTTDYNAEMIGHIEKHPALRDRAIFVGQPSDIVPLSFGKDLPAMREWIPRHFDFSGYIMGEHPSAWGSRAELREKFGYRAGEKVCIVTVGGSGVGVALIGRILRMIVVTGPRIDPRSLIAPPGVEVRAFVPDLDQHLAACDLALVQGGLTTCMELTAAGTPFLFFPLRNHFEQNFHVAHRLGNYGAGRRLDYATATPEIIADAAINELRASKTFKPVEADGAARAARMLADLI